MYLYPQPSENPVFTDDYYNYHDSQSLTCLLRSLMIFLTERSLLPEQEHVGFVPLITTHRINTRDGNVAIFEIRDLNPEQEERVNRYLKSLISARDADLGWKPLDPSPPEEDDVEESPIYFSLVRSTSGRACTLYQKRYLIAEVRYDCVTPEEAERQLSLLMRFLSAPENVTPLTDHDRSFL